MAYRERLAQLCAERGTLCVGLDPHASIVEGWGLDYDLAGIEKVARDTVAALGDSVPVYKPQSAFYECFGPAGLEVLGRVLNDIREVGALSILDVKRGDIGSTMAAYAQAYLGDGAPLRADAITLSPYCGFDALRPALERAREAEAGVYVLCRTSNPDGTGLQLAHSDSGRSIAQYIVDSAVAENHAAGTSFIGLVIGATHSYLDVRLNDFAGSILAPGLGAQGGTVDSMRQLFGPALTHALPSVSRGVLAVGPDHAALLAAADSFRVRVDAI